MQIVINIDDKTGQVTVETDGQEPQQFDSTDQAAQYVDDLLSGEESQESPDQEASEGPESSEQGEEPGESGPSDQQMWDEENAKRKSIYG